MILFSQSTWTVTPSNLMFVNEKMKLKPNLILVATVLFLNVLSGESNAVDPPGDKQPNVIFILVDDLGWGDLGVLHQNGSTHDRKHKTPFLDQMAAEGMQLRAHYCPAPVCAPSRASLLTGVHQGHATVRDNQFDKELIDNHTLATVMQAAGYRTALIGKYGLQGQGQDYNSWPAYPTKRGFDEFFGYVRHVDGHVHYPADLWPLGNSESHRTGKQVWWNDKEVSSQLEKCYTTDLFTARAKHWIAEHSRSNPEQPFFLYLAYDTPHGALQVPAVPYPEGHGLKAGLQWTGKPGAMINTAVGEIDSFRHPDYVGRGWSDVEERFATMVRRIDNAIGDLLQTLKDLNIAEDTLVVFTSDNGPHHESYLSEMRTVEVKQNGNTKSELKRVGIDYEANSFQSYGPFDGTKRDTWDGGIRMPTLAWWPGHVPAGSTNEEPSQFHDWMPTLAEVAGKVAPARTDGVSLVPTLTGQGDQAASTVYVEYEQNGRTKSYSDFMESRRGKKRGQMQVIFLDGFKGVRTDIQSHSDLFEIYDLKTDPGERKNLAGVNRQFDQLQQQMHDRVLRLRIANESAKRPYDREPIPGLEIANGPTGNTIQWSAFHGEFSYVPNVSSIQPDETGQARMTQASTREPGAVEFRLGLEVDQPGEYTLSFQCPTKGFVRVHDAGVIDADFGYQAGTNKTAKLNLGKGYHPVRIIVLTDRDGLAACKFDWSTPSK